MKRLFTFLTLLVLFTFLLPAALGANDPGHDTLYIEQNGNSQLSGSLNITKDLEVAQRIYSDYLDVRGDGTITGSYNRIIGQNGQLYIESSGDVIFNDQIGTTSTVRIGDTGDSVAVAVTGSITQGGIPLCLANGTHCVSGNNSGNVSSITGNNGISVSPTTGDVVVSLASGSAGAGLGYSSGVLSVNTGTGLTTSGDNVLIDSTVCTTSNGLCGGVSSGAGWTNDSTTTSTALNVNITTGNLTVPNGWVGIGTSSPTHTLDVAGTIMAETGLPSNLVNDPYFSTTSRWAGSSGQERVLVTLPTGESVQGLLVNTSGDVMVQSDLIPVNRNTTYRFSVWMSSNNTANGTRYFGLYCYNSSQTLVNCTTSAGGKTTDPYFWNGDLSPANTLRKITGYLFPDGTSGWSVPADTTSSNFGMSNDTTYVRLRLLNYNNSGVPVSNTFALPRVEIVEKGGMWVIGTSSSGNASYLSLAPGYNIGIGTGTPGEELEVVGNINSTGGDICISGGMCLSQASSGNGDVTDVLAGTGINVTSPGGPQPTVSVNNTWLNAHYVGQSEYPDLDTDNTDDLITSTSFTGDVTGNYNTIVVRDDSHTHNAANITSGTLAFARGGTGLGSASDDTLMVSSGSAWQAKSIPDCDAGMLRYDTTGNTFSCGPDGGGNITGVGTTNTLTKWTGSGTLGNSLISDDGSVITLAGSMRIPTSFYMGYGATASSGGITIGANSEASGSYALAFGTQAVTKSNKAIAIGYTANASDSYATVVGATAKANGQYSVATGYGAQATNIHSIAIGGNALAAGNGFNIAIGYNTQLTTGASQYSIAIGEDAWVQGSDAIALGYGANVSDLYSVALGRDATTTANNQFMIGSSGYNLNPYVYGYLTVTSATTSAFTGNITVNGGEAVCTAANGLCNQTDEVDTLISGRACYTTGTNVNCDDAFYWNSGSNYLGIGVNPSYNLHVAGTANISDVYVQSDGDVGIGTASPTAKLDVAGNASINNTLYVMENGNVRIENGSGSPGNATGAGDLWVADSIEYEGNLYGPGADIAERTPASEQGLEPGTVVEIDPDAPGSVRRSTRAYSTLVAGVVSTRPGITLGKDVQGAALAVTGRVPVQANDENGPIAAGDLLTTSSVPGEAMACRSAERCFGAILGKAMEPLSGREGTITALVTIG